MVRQRVAGFLLVVVVRHQRVSFQKLIDSVIPDAVQRKAPWRGAVHR
jgi:hypothetical protein